MVCSPFWLVAAGRKCSVSDGPAAAAGLWVSEEMSRVACMIYVYAWAGGAAAAAGVVCAAATWRANLDVLKCKMLRKPNHIPNCC